MESTGGRPPTMKKQSAYWKRTDKRGPHSWLFCGQPFGGWIITKNGTDIFNHDITALNKINES